MTRVAPISDPGSPPAAPQRNDAIDGKKLLSRRRTPLPLPLVALLILLPLLAGCPSKEPGLPDASVDPQAIFAGAEPPVEDPDRSAAVQETVWSDTPVREGDSKEPSSSGRRFWKRFRGQFPFHMQAITVSRPVSGVRSVLISEPPPHVTLAQIQALLPDAATLRHPIGYDGWVTDVVATVPGSPDEWATTFARLNRLLFRTGYKAYALEEPLRRPRYHLTEYGFDVSVTVAELRKWLLEDSAGQDAFLAVDSGHPYSLAELKVSQLSRVLFFRKGRLVVWWLPKGVPITKSLVQARQFALDSDLVVGAIKLDQGLLIAGRERRAPVDYLPPLRVETIALLASVKDEELKQSYQRTSLLAGTKQDGWDWAPILLSPELVDSEYGSLLNITDQLLKGWSLAGEVDYHRFDQYPRPRTFAYREPLIRHLNTSQLTFNWNTTGAGYSSSRGPAEVYALNRTGALPISYIPGEKESAGTEKVVDAEQAEYDWFAGQHDPNLVRVVQYAALYQIFRNLDVGQSAGTVPTNDALADGFSQVVRNFLSEAASASSAERDEAARLAIKTGRAKAGIDRRLRHLGLSDSGESAGESGELEKKLAELLDAEFGAAVREGYKAWRGADAGEREAIAGFVATIGTPDKDTIETAVMQAGDPREWKEKYGGFLEAYAALKRVPDRITEAVAASPRSWIHTCSVVVSRGIGSMQGGVGGHNLDAKITRFEVDKALAKGQVRYENGTVRYSPADEGKLGSIVRSAARSAKNSEGDADAISRQIKASLQRERNAAPRQVEVAVGGRGGRGGSPPPPDEGVSGRGFSDEGGRWRDPFGQKPGGPDEPANPFTGRRRSSPDGDPAFVFGFQQRRQPPREVLDWAANAQDHEVFLYKENDVIWVLMARRPPRAFSVLGHADIGEAIAVWGRDYVQPGERMTIRMMNFTEAEAGSVAESTRARLNGPSGAPPRDIIGIVEVQTGRRPPELSTMAYHLDRPSVTPKELRMENGRPIGEIHIEFPPATAGENLRCEVELQFKENVSLPRAGEVQRRTEAGLKAFVASAPSEARSKPLHATAKGFADPAGNLVWNFNEQLASRLKRIKVNAPELASARARIIADGARRRDLVDSRLRQPGGVDHPMPAAALARLPRRELLCYGRIDSFHRSAWRHDAGLEAAARPRGVRSLDDRAPDVRRVRGGLELAA